MPLLERHPNLVVLRTFSKAMALAGLRVGYLLASPDLVREVNKARLPYNLNFFSQAAALAALEEYEGVLAPTVGRLVGERERLLARLADVPGVRAYASDANFFLLECTSADPKAVFAGLLRRGVLVRDVTSYPMLSRCLRVSVGSEEENDAFLHALGTALTEAGMDLTTGGPDGERQASEGPGSSEGPRRTKRTGSPERATSAAASGSERSVNPVRAPRPRLARVDRKTRETDIVLVAEPRRRGPVPRRAPASASSTTCWPPSPRTPASTSTSAAGATCTWTRTTPSRTWGSPWARRSGRRWATRRASSASATPTCRSTRRSRGRSSTSPGGPGCTSACSSAPSAIGDMPTELVEDFFWALVDHGRFNLHLDVVRGRNAHHIAETLFKATARALAMATSRDPRVKDVPCTKGSLRRMIAIVDYGIGNLGSVTKAFRRAGAEVLLTGDAETLRRADALVLPGDGAFGATMDEVERSGLAPVLREAAETGQAAPRDLHRHAAPLRGERGARPAPRPRAPPGPGRAASRASCPCPHMGWNRLPGAAGAPDPRRRARRRARLLRPLVLRATPADDVVIATTDYGRDFAAIVGPGNVLGVQFHPEKSQEVGLRMVENFVRHRGRARGARRDRRPRHRPAGGAGRAADARAASTRRPSTPTTRSEAARRWEARAPSCLHVVDLDAAIDGRPQPRRDRGRSSRPCASRSRSAAGCATRIDDRALRELGVERVDLRDRRALAPEVVPGTPSRSWPRSGARWRSTPATGGWRSPGWNEVTRPWTRSSSPRRSESWASCASSITDIRRDGTLVGPNVAAIEALGAADAACASPRRAASPTPEDLGAPAPSSSRSASTRSSWARPSTRAGSTLAAARQADRR